MGREIKFRGRFFTGKWIYGDLIHLSTGYGIRERTGATLSFSRVDEDTIGQYTGLKDCNDKEIYEGDIVKGVSHKSDSCISELIPFDVIGVVGYHKEYQTLEVRTRQASLHIEVAIKGEVIGNIHDNPELLKGGK